MTDQGERYDRVAAGYAQWWAPVLEARAIALLDRAQAAVEGGARRLIDVGTGTGTLARAAVRRWPAVKVTGIDLSAGMIGAAEAEADRLLAPDERRRFVTRVAPADALPFADAAFDAAISSFVLQLVPNRFRALREIHRVLRPGGTLAYVTWLIDDRVFRPDVEFDALLDEIGIGAREPEGRPGDIPSVDAAAAQLRRAGFGRVAAERAVLDHQFTVEGYVRFLAEFDEEDLISSLSARERDRLLDGLRDRLAGLPPADLLLRYPIVYARGIRP
ncbi:MAG TPA: class I SAM-dependent methyltransferase [Candidatus Limnocylindrales bacterium]|nr:class I SAM-dependent methyltransferase [Candidatus Limnocylindrales bacterium]